MLTFGKMILSEAPSIEDVKKQLTRVKEHHNFMTYDHAKSFVILKAYNEEHPNNDMEKEINEAISTIMDHDNVKRGLALQREQFKFK